MIAVLASAIQLGERPPAVELTGMALIGGALALLGWLGVRRDMTVRNVTSQPGFPPPRE